MNFNAEDEASLYLSHSLHCKLSPNCIQ